MTYWRKKQQQSKIILLTLKKKIMKNYSRQLGKFIESKFYADSVFRETDSRTWVSYYQDNDGFIHSDTFNYSIVKCEPVTVEGFKKLVEKNPDANVIFA